MRYKINNLLTKRPITIYEPLPIEKRHWRIRSKIRLAGKWMWPLELDGDHYQMCESEIEAIDIIKELQGEAYV